MSGNMTPDSSEDMILYIDPEDDLVLEDSEHRIPPAMDVKNDVTFYDYDGTVVAGYSAEDFGQLLKMPPNPSHDGLVAQGWNWSLADAKTYVAKYGSLNIGQMYVTESGATEIDVVMPEGRLSPILTVCVDGIIAIDWGDGTTPEGLIGSGLDDQHIVHHTYAQTGSYTISISATGNTKYKFYGSSSYTILSKGTTANENQIYANTVKHVRIGNNAIIDYCAFQTCYALASITIPDSVTSIGYGAFERCYSLASITIPNSVTSIGGYAFEYCNSLASVTIPDSVTSIGEYAFEHCYTLASVTLPYGITSIESNVFHDCTALANVTIPDSVTSIKSDAFFACYSLASITIPDSVTSIASYAFCACYSLKSVTIPDSVTSIERSVFANCYTLPSVTIPDGVTSIGLGAFSYCYTLPSITIPDGVTSIGQQAFCNCFSLSSITIPDSVTSIEYGAFQGCYGVKEYHILPTTPPTAGSTIFLNISSDCVIYVPSASLNAYKTATNWSTYASKIQAEPT